ncbi:MAG: hypothetical protein FJ318_03325 [SAR202 cluster bacterium]|nr:hypothetical protein [SAR202 cluster bacterium]
MAWMTTANDRPKWATDDDEALYAIPVGLLREAYDLLVEPSNGDPPYRPWHQLTAHENGFLITKARKDLFDQFSGNPYYSWFEILREVAREGIEQGGVSA